MAVTECDTGCESEATTPVAEAESVSLFKVSDWEAVFTASTSASVVEVAAATALTLATPFEAMPAPVATLSHLPQLVQALVPFDFASKVIQKCSMERCPQSNDDTTFAKEVSLTLVNSGLDDTIYRLVECKVIGKSLIKQSECS